jgi:hypothetical protein
MKPYDTSSTTSDTQTDHEMCGTDACNVSPVFNDDNSQLDVAIIHQMVVDAMKALAASNAMSAAGRQRRTQRFVAWPLTEHN